MVPGKIRFAVVRIEMIAAEIRQAVNILSSDVFPRDQLVTDLQFLEILRKGCLPGSFPMGMVGIPGDGCDYRRASPG